MPGIAFGADEFADVTPGALRAMVHEDAVFADQRRFLAGLAKRYAVCAGADLDRAALGQVEPFAEFFYAPLALFVML